jgi:hypothetical protein
MMKSLLASQRKKWGMQVNWSDSMFSATESSLEKNQSTSLINMSTFSRLIASRMIILLLTAAHEGLLY